MQWRFDAIEDRAVFEMLIAARYVWYDEYPQRRLFWMKYSESREPYLAAVTLCLKWGHTPSRMLCL